MPTLAIDDATDLLLSDSVFDSQCGLLDSALCIPFSDLMDIFIRQPSHTMVRSCVVGDLSSSLDLSVCVIGRYGTKKPVIWIVARGCVTGVTNAHSRRDWSDLDFVSNPSGNATAPLNTEKSVSVTSQTSLPEPTLIRQSASNSRPVSFLNGVMRTHDGYDRPDALEREM